MLLAAHMLKIMFLDHPNPLLPCHHIILKFVIQDRGQTIFLNDENEIKKACQLNIHPIINHGS
jgi:hypothetical protein